MGKADCGIRHIDGPGGDDVKKEIGPGAFERYYSELFGERWDTLRHALLDGGGSIELTHGFLTSYWMDGASLVAGMALNVQPGDDVVDLCAAPGGKTLVLARMLAGTGTLVANERSSARRARLHRVLNSHLPEAWRATVRITGHDAAKWGVFRPQSADRVLADVPCSSEQHVLTTDAALAQWTPSRTKRLARDAYAIACAAADSLRPGGEMVYSTCALSPLENDGVIDRLMKRSGSSMEVILPESRIRALPASDAPLPAAGMPGEATDHGWSFLPDTAAGLGPLYLCILRRR
ncbi:MAG: RsmB/NOP family class I SAM-dependent RNA methyltransferase [Spirochaetales bacterium]|nr:MAG: RsmB/NOP family class I SAM-dependent RNA methyltransferase [Spirochaetales bacterium]